MHRPVMLELAGCNLIGLTIRKLLGLAVVPVLHSTVVAGNTAEDLSLLPTVRAHSLLAIQIPMVFADGIGGAGSFSPR